MRKNLYHAFTLIEMLISIFIVSLIIFYLYFAVNNFKTSNQFFREKQEQDAIKERFFKVIYEDFLESESKTTTVEVRDKDFDIVSFRTRNSHHHLYLPYVAYYVARSGEFLRVESQIPVKLPADLESDGEYEAEIITEGISRFKTFYNKDKEALLVYLKREDDNHDMFFQLEKAYVLTESSSSSDQNSTGGTSGDSSSSTSSESSSESNHGDQTSSDADSGPPPGIPQG